VRTHTGIGGKAVAATALVAVALGGVATAAADVVPGTEDGWGHPPGGVMLTVDGDDGSGNHTLTLTWGNIDPVLKDDGYWLCAVTERSTTTRKGTEGSNSGNVPVLNLAYDVKLLPATGGSSQRQVSAPAGERLQMGLQCSTHWPGAFATTPPSALFGWEFQYQLS